MNQSLISLLAKIKCNTYEPHRERCMNTQLTFPSPSVSHCCLLLAKSKRKPESKEALLMNSIQISFLRQRAKKGGKRMESRMVVEVVGKEN